MAGNKWQRGFSLTELMIAIAMTAIIIMMSSDVFTTILSQSGQQVKVASSEMESIIGLRILRYDIEHAGFGLPGRFQGGINYQEAASAPANNYNDSPDGVPRAVVTGNDAGFNNSDYLVIKSTAVGTSNTGQKWTYIVQGGNAKVWGSSNLDLAVGNRVIVIRAKSTNEPSQDASLDELIIGANFFTQYQAVFPNDFSPQTPSERFIVYGVDEGNLRMPFNRADYYIARRANDIRPSCAPNTGTLYKSTVNHADGALTEMPIIDCVADMQVIFRRDTDGDGAVDATTNTLAGLNAQQIRGGVREVRVYILAQEGQRDLAYKHTPSVVAVGEFGLGSNFDLAATIGQGWENYRWKVYTLVVKPKQLQ